MLKKKGIHRIKYRNITIGIVCVIIMCISILTSIYMTKNIEISNYDNELRILVNQATEQEYPTMEVNLSGRVLSVDDAFGLKVGDTINVQELIQRDKSFKARYPNKEKLIQTKESDGMIVGFVVTLIPEDLVTRKNVKVQMIRCLIPLFLGGFVTLGVLTWLIIDSNTKMLKPMEEISTSASHIICGDYDYEVVRVYDTKVASNEIGQLIYSFELMRDELRAGRIKEEEIKKSSKELISCISHDLKTPLSTVKAYAEGLRDGIANNEDSRKKFTNIIIEKTDLIIGMTEELLKFSNAELNKLDIVREEVYFREFYLKLMNEIKVYVENAGINFESILLLEDCIVNIDTKRIEEVFYNLVENSMKYRKSENPRIQIYAEYVENRIEIHVKDNGIGINAVDIPYVFDKFFRAEKSRSSRIHGSGLGLSICKYIVEQHGGEIHCISNKNEGCDMFFSLPV